MNREFVKLDDLWTYELSVDNPEYEPQVVMANGDVASIVDARKSRLIKIPYENKLLPEAEHYVMEYPVTMEQYLQFCATSGHRIPSDEGWGYGRQPVINVNEHDVFSYINWLNELYGYPFRYILTYNEDGSYKEFTVGELVDPETGEVLEGFRLPDQNIYKAYVADADDLPNKEQVIVHAGNSNGRAQPVDFAVNPDTGEDMSRNVIGAPATLGNVWVMVVTAAFMTPFYERAHKNYLKHKKQNKES